MVRDGRGCFATTTTRSIWKSALIILFLKIFKQDVELFVSDFFTSFRMPPGTNSAFITLLPKFGFGEKWRKRIQICLHSARTSILVNGSPTSEFSIKKGFRQGDPLSPFLFVLVMEGLHIAIKDACQANLIKGVTVGTPEQMAWATAMPFTYLGHPIAVNMNRLNRWQEDAGFDHISSTTKETWRNVVGFINHLHDCCIVPKDTLKHKVGCGTKVRFWIATWIGDDPLALRYNRLNRLDVQPYCFIRDRFINREWKMQWKRPIVYGRINAMWESLQAELQHVTPFRGHDEVCWGIGHNGKFTTSASVKSFKTRVGNPINLMSEGIKTSSTGRSKKPQSERPTTRAITYGTVVDVFIPLKKSKAGKRFAFVRFVKINNIVRLVENLCTIWIGRHHLYANQARFERPQKSYSSHNVTRHATPAGINTNVVNSPGDASVASFSEQVGHQFNNTGGSVLDIMEGFIKVVVYAPQLSLGKKNLLDYLLNILGRWNGEVIVMGDFNEVRSSNERRGSCFNPYSARHFDRFIYNSGLIDIPLEGYAFTWSHPSASKMSKLDRFLISDGVFSLFSSITAVCFDRHLSDHRPILLREVYVDFGPIPFRFYHSWFDHVGFDEMIKSAWVSFSHSDGNSMIRFKKKLQDLKLIIRCWIRNKKHEASRLKNNLVAELGMIDLASDRGVADE
nr:RNA-directed DNA polymerase, eukaryota [Tanacetum cinerariifolium]